MHICNLEKCCNEYLFFEFTCKHRRRYSREQASQSGGGSQTGDAPVMIGSDRSSFGVATPTMVWEGPHFRVRVLLCFFCMLFCFFETTCLRAKKKHFSFQSCTTICQVSINQSIIEPRGRKGKHVKIRNIIFRYQCRMLRARRRTNRYQLIKPIFGLQP